jgi:hypothetical protein
MRRCVAWPGEGRAALDRRRRVLRRLRLRPRRPRISRDEGLHCDFAGSPTRRASARSSPTSSAVAWGAARSASRRAACAARSASRHAARPASRRAARRGRRPGARRRRGPGARRRRSEPCAGQGRGAGEVQARWRRRAAAALRRRAAQEAPTASCFFLISNQPLPSVFSLALGKAPDIVTATVTVPFLYRA